MDLQATNWNERSKTINENSVAHGWWETERPYAEISVLIRTELSEAVEEFRHGKPLFYYGENGKPEGSATECCDAVIRILDYCGRYNLDIHAAINDEDVQEAAGGYDPHFPTFIEDLNDILTDARRRREKARTLKLAAVIVLIWRWCADNGVDFEQTLDVKHIYNVGREYRHGGRLV